MAPGLARRRVRLAGRSRTLYAPSGDPFLAGLGRSRRYAEFHRFCARCLKPDDVFLDVGANIGVTSIIASEHLGRGRILAIEASPANGEALRRNLGINLGARSRTEIHVEICAIGAESGTRAFHEASAFGFVMDPRSMLASHPTIAVPMRTIDQLVEERGLERVDVIKLDVEGYEWEALRGAERTLARHDPLVFLEFNSWCQIAFYDRSPRAFLDYLLATFPELHLWRNGTLVPVRDLGAAGLLRTNLLDDGCVSDLVGVRSAARLPAPERTGPLRYMSRLLGR